jgi:GDPmannose 4,6-dehydratase
MPNALITGIRGQDGAYLARLLLEKNYTVWGTVRSQATRTEVTSEVNVLTEESLATPSLAALGIAEKVRLIAVDYLEINSLARAIDIAAPDEVYNLAAQSSVARSFDAPTETGEVTALSVARLLHVLRAIRPEAHFYQASSSEMYGQSLQSPQTETTPFYPRSPYAAAKLYAHWMTVNYREAYGLHASCGILFNHESPLRPERFVTRKVTSSVARIKHGLQKDLYLGDLDVQRDWGFAGDYVEAMWLMLQQDTPDDYVIATGTVHSLRDFVRTAFECANLRYEDHVRIDEALLRPTEVHAVVGCNDKAKKQLNWQPRMNFQELIQFLVEAELKRVQNDESSIRYIPEQRRDF